MEVVKLKMDEAIFVDLIKSGQLQFRDVEVIQIEPNDYDYSDNEKWVEAKSASTKAYKKLKEIEFKIRNQ